MAEQQVSANDLLGDVTALQDIATNGKLLAEAIAKVIETLEGWSGLVIGTSHGGTGQSYGGLVPKYTTTERNALTSPPDGLLIYNTTTSKFQGRAGGAWVDLH